MPWSLPPLLAALKPLFGTESLLKQSQSRSSICLVTGVRPIRKSVPQPIGYPNSQTALALGRDQLRANVPNLTRVLLRFRSEAVGFLYRPASLHRARVGYLRNPRGVLASLFPAPACRLLFLVPDLRTPGAAPFGIGLALGFGSAPW